MSTKTSIPFQPIDFDVAKRAIDEITVERQLPTQVVTLPTPSGEGRVESPKPHPVVSLLPQPSPTRNFNVDLPDYLIDALHARALQTKPRCTVRSIIFQSLRANGFEIKDVDMIPDGRRRSRA